MGVSTTPVCESDVVQGRIMMHVLENCMPSKKKLGGVELQQNIPEGMWSSNIMIFFHKLAL